MAGWKIALIVVASLAGGAIVTYLGFLLWFGFAMSRILD